MRNVLKAKSSDGTSSYSVEFNLDGNRLEVFCDCRAGVLGQHCRHKEGLIRGDRALLLDSSDGAVLDEVVNWVRRSPVGTASTQLRDAEEKLKAAQVAVRAAKKSLENAMRPS
jgi:hypothetical protein